MPNEEKYKLVDLIQRKSKENKIYYLAVVLLTSNSNCDLMQILVNEEQAKKISTILANKYVDVSNNIEIKYNSYQKKYQPVLKSI